MSLDIIGVDISNNNSINDLSSLSNNGVKYLYLKATEGATFKDVTSKYRYVQAKNLGLKVGFYHFLASTSSADAQAENFYNYVKNYSSDLIPMLDIEKDFNGMSKAVIEFIKHFKELSGLDIGIYTYSGFLNSFTQEVRNTIKDLPCWIANYTSNYSSVDVGFFTNIVGWQHSENGTIGSFTGDCNFFSEGCLLEKGEWVNDSNGYWYKHKDGSYTKSNWEQIKGKWYYFDDRGYAYQNRWLKSPFSGKWYYFRDDCSMNTDAQLIYNFNSDGTFIK